MAEKPTFKQRLTDCGTFIWNAETHQFLGRTGRSWGEITFFYLIYYICLAGFFAACFSVFNTTLDDHFPKLQGGDSLIRSNPGLGFKPMPDLDTTLIRYDISVKKTYDPYVKHINDFLDKRHRNQSDELVDCGNSTGFREEEAAACKVDISEALSKCGDDFGYKLGKPCILLKLNKIFDWIPEPYELGDLPETMPKKLKAIYDQTKVWVSCEGENAGDNDNLGEVKYYPTQGFDMHFFPYKNQPGYIQPIIFAHLANIEPHVGMLVECKAWAKNIWHDRTERQGSIHFEIIVD